MNRVLNRRFYSLLTVLLFLFMFLTGLAYGTPARSESESVSRTDQTEAVPQGVYTSLDQLADKEIGVQTGSSFDLLVTEKLPDAKKLYFNSKSDMVNALLGKKIDAFVTDEPVVREIMRQYAGLTYISEDPLENFECALAFPRNSKGEKLRQEFNAFLARFKADGKLEEMEAKWFGEDESIKDIPVVPEGDKGILRVATEAAFEPFEYVRNGQIVGYDVDLVSRFCIENGYGLEMVDMVFDGVLTSIQTGKCDFAAAGITVTPERMESVLFSEPNYAGRIVAVVRVAESSKDENGFQTGILDSFRKTFLREDRWKLFLEGVGNTLIITVLSIVLGTALGFGVFMLCRNGNPLANGMTRFMMWLIQGTPVVVLLMILYYIIFGSVSVTGIFVSVIGFSLTFGSAVFSLLKMGVGAVDPGQYEAAYALGYSNRRTFFRFILPQALPHVISAYQGEIVGLIKATAVVGYIAVQDLTKMGDIVRSRTYEAFFPLIAITLIYFLLEGLFSFLVSRIRIHLDPKRRKKGEVLKGVKIHD